MSIKVTDFSDEMEKIISGNNGDDGNDRRYVQESLIVNGEKKEIKVYLDITTADKEELIKYVVDNSFDENGNFLPVISKATKVFGILKYFTDIEFLEINTDDEELNTLNMAKNIEFVNQYCGNGNYQNDSNNLLSYDSVLFEIQSEIEEAIEYQKKRNTSVMTFLPILNGIVNNMTKLYDSDFMEKFTNNVNNFSVSSKQFKKSADKIAKANIEVSPKTDRKK